MADATAPEPEAHRDELPEDLDVTAWVGPYTFPDNARRRWPALWYALIGAACIGGYLARGDAVLVNRGLLVGGLVLLAIAVQHVLAAAPLRVREVDALAAASRGAGFPIGHASAQLGWRGLLSRPTWRILVYSAEDPPAQRGLVLVDGVDGEVVDAFTEENPEDWSAMTSGSGRTTSAPSDGTEATRGTSGPADGEAAEPPA